MHPNSSVKLSLIPPFSAFLQVVRSGFSLPFSICSSFRTVLILTVYKGSVMCILAVLTSYWKLRLEYYKNVTGAYSLGLCAKIKKTGGQREAVITGMEMVTFSE